jgi:hypothetical protein
MENEKILSWDVGMINLAYCLLEKENNKFKINKWGIINLSENDKFCKFITNKKKECGKTAKFQIRHKNDEKFTKHICDTYYTCLTHQDKFNPIFIENDDDEQICKECSNIATEIIKDCDIGWCEKHLEKQKKIYLKNIVKKKVVGTSSKEQPIQNTALKLYKILDEMPEFLQVDKILIENQPALKNPPIKTIGTLLYSYFIMKGLKDKNITKSLITEVKFISPSNKLKINKLETDKNLNPEKQKKINKEKNNFYRITKNLGITYCKALINDDDLKLLNSYKKKDDLCDAFLQGFQYFFNPIPDDYIKKLESSNLKPEEENNKVIVEKTNAKTNTDK